MKEFFSSPAMLLLCIMIIMSIILFLTMAVDKRRAVKGRYRVPERRLFILAILGGAIGGWGGMYAFHHKTRHLKFVICFPLFAILQLAGLIWMFIM